MHAFMVFLRKDLKASLWSLIAMWGLAGVAIVCPQSGPLGEEVLGWASLSMQLSILCVMAMLIQQWILFGSEPPYGTTRFIATRPVSAGSVFGSKVAVTILGGILPVLLVVGIGLLRSGVPVSWIEIASVLGNDLWILLSLSGMLAMHHGVQTGWLRTLLTICVILLTPVTFLLLTQRGIWLPSSTDFLIPGLMAFAWAGWTLLATRYLRCKRWTSIAATVMAGALAAWVAPLFSGETTSRPTATETNGSDLAFTLEPDSSGLQATWQGARKNLDLHYSSTLKGLPERVYAEVSGYAGTLVFRGEPYIHTFDEEMPHYTSTISPAAVLGLLPGHPTLTQKERENWARYWLPAASISLSEKPKDNVTHITVRGEHHFNLYRAELCAMLPLKRDTVWQREAIRLRMHDLTNRFAVVMEGDVVGSHFKATAQRLQNGTDGWDFFGVNLPARQLCAINALPAATLWHPLQQRMLWVENWSFQTRIIWSPTDGEAADSAPAKMDPAQTQLAIFRRVLVGRVTVPFEFVDTEVVIR